MRNNQELQFEEVKNYKNYNSMNNLSLYGKEEISQKEINLREQLSMCGMEARVNSYCKQCESQGSPALLESLKKPFYCEIRYCDNPECKSYLFAQQFEKIKDIGKFKVFDSKTKTWVLRDRLGHFVIGFPKLHISDFRANFSKHKKRYEQVMNSFFKRLRKLGFPIHAVRAMDFSFVDKDHVFPHFHFGCVPFAMGKMKSYLTNMQVVRSSMIKNQKIKTPFHLQFFKNAGSGGVLGYIAMRGVGLYKHESTEDSGYQVPKRGNLLENIINKRYFMLSDVLDHETYVKHFYKKRMFAGIGDVRVPYSSTSTDMLTLNCKIHGPLCPSDRDKVRIERVFEVKPLFPPDLDQEFKVIFEKVYSGNF